MKSYPGEPRYTPPPERCAALLLGAIRRRGRERDVIVQSFDFRVVRAMHRLAPEMRLAALVEDGEPDFIASARAAQAKIIAPEFHLVTAEKVAAAHAAGIEVVPWTVNLACDWERLAGAGVDGIITDDPAALIAGLDSRR